jgi:nucleoside-diphosphate-sugar epimerase
MAKKVLVTGAAGLIGRELCKQLSNEFDVVGVDNNFRYPDFVPECNYIKQELSQYIKNTENDFDYVFHMAAINGTKYFYEIPNQLIENNINLDLSIFNFIKKNKNCKLIYASSSEVVAGVEEFPTTETANIQIADIHNPRWSYRLGKIVAENYLMNSDLNFLIIRFFNVFGKDSGSGHFIKDILDKIDKENYSLVGAEETRSFCRVEDAVDAVIKIFSVASKEIINVGSEEEISILEAADIIANQKNKIITWNNTPGLPGSVKRRKPCLKKLKKYYKEYNPRSFKDAVKDL